MTIHGVERTRANSWSTKHDDLNPQTSSVHGEAEMAVGLKDRALLWRGILDARSDQRYFYVQYKRELVENGIVIRSKQWQATVPRDGQ
jgi:hypothetical protein